jgi:WD40-like Beta Propeller Repeat
LVKNESSLKEPISSSSEPDKIKRPETLRIRSVSVQKNWSVLAFLSLVVIFLVLFSGQFVNALIQVTSPIAQVVPRLDSTLQGRGGSVLKSFDLPAHRTMLYEQNGNIYSVTTLQKQNSGQGAEETAQAESDAVTQPLQIETPGYQYNPSLPPLVTPAGQLIYAGTGLWMVDLAHNQPRQIATLGDDQEVTSLVLSRDGSQLAWSSAPRDGQGEIQIFAGPVGSTKLVYQQTAGLCPCFRVFSFWPASDIAGHDTLLLTDDHGDDGPVRHGLWVFPLDKGASVKPALAIKSDPPQGPLTVSPDNTNLLYTTYEGDVPVPDDLPDELATVGYANSLVLASLQNTAPYLVNTHVLLPEQKEQGNSAQYHWVMSPGFSPDGQTLVYVEFSADSQGSFTRTNALYMVQMHGDTVPIRPALVATTAAHYIELGNWWDAHTVTVFIDKGFYALDVQKGLLAKINETDGYAHEIAVLN